MSTSLQISHNSVEAQNFIPIAHVNGHLPGPGISIPLRMLDLVKAKGYNSLAPFQPSPSLTTTDEEMAKGQEAEDRDGTNIDSNSEYEETYLDLYLRN